MDDIVKDKEIEYTRENAKAEFANGNYPLAKTIFETLWDNSSKNDVYLLYDYGQALRKVKESITFVEICRELNGNQNIMLNKWIISTLCWCLYDCYIKNYSVADKDGFDDFIKRAEYIKNNCIQMNANEHYKTPYVLTIKKVVKIYNERASKNFKEIIKWLSYLDPDILSEEVFNFQDEAGKDRELASPKEFYYQHMAKALEKIEKFEECITICETAFKQITKFHYRNDTWLKARMYYSKCMIQEDIENAIEEYKALAYKENYWFIYHKLSLICWRFNKLSDALLYASKAYICRFEHEKMVNLMLDTALLWQATGNNANAKLFFQASAFYRERQGWPVPEELQYAISVLEIDIEEKPNIRAIQHVSNDYIATIEGKTDKFKGKIENILPHGGAGFIKPRHGGSNIYFNMKGVLGKRILSKGDIVEYEVYEGKDGKMRAIKITKRSEKNDRNTY
ncbi:hypothetical protein [Lutispora sp.]|uniref:hypothetical protein n=1 Tax=Lutispora sp. TaxID=2828727 RepID=UPI0035619FAC